MPLSESIGGNTASGSDRMESPPHIRFGRTYRKYSGATITLREKTTIAGRMAIWRHHLGGTIWGALSGGTVWGHYLAALSGGTVRGGRRMGNIAQGQGPPRAAAASAGRARREPALRA